MSLDWRVGVSNILDPGSLDLERFEQTSPHQPFSPQSVDFLASLSRNLLAWPGLRDHPDVATFAFWIRRASLEALRESHGCSGTRLGRGLVFHVTPGNVPVNFAYSLAAGLLAGNANIVRVPSRNYRQVEIVSSAIASLQEQDQYAHMRYRIALIKYDRTYTSPTDALSKMCDVRVIWGGDESVFDVRRSPLKARAYDVTFPDRYSIAVIGADAYLEVSNKRKVAQDFYNDTYLLDQNACSAPHLVLWLGSDISVREARRQFWLELNQVAMQRYDLSGTAAIGKLTTAYKYASTHPETNISRSQNNYLNIVTIPELSDDLDSSRGNCGIFFEYSASEIDSLAEIVNTKYQTLAYLGVDPQKVRSFVMDNQLKGIDRIVPIGKTLDFSLDWDGYSLIDSLSRVVSVVR